MGRRSRQRAAGPGEEHPRREPARVDPASAPRTPRVRARMDEAPPAPWHPFPLVELAVLAGLVLIVVAFVLGGDGRPVLLFGGLALISVAALELSIREHFAGFRSHSTLLAAVVGIGGAIPLWWTPVPQEVLIVVALLIGFVAWRGLRATFVRKSGGLPWRA
jgi:uncharacterized membrane protein